MPLPELIREAWRNACHNGNEALLREMSPYFLACDMFDCDAEIAKHEFDDVYEEVQHFITSGFQ